MKQIELFGTRLDSFTMAETVELINKRIAKRHFTQHAVVNVAKLVNMKQDTELRASVTDCDIINIDGMGVVWGARLLGLAVPERVSGVDLFHHLLEMSAGNSYSVFLLGAKMDIVTKVSEIVSQQYPALKIAGLHHGYFWDDEEAMVDKIKKSGARLLFVAISSPQKENFINRWKDKLGVDFVMGVGGTFDVVAGKVKRAPEWMQKAGLEWLYRVIQEPGRMWKRYLYTNSKFAFMLFTELFGKKTST